MFKIIVYLDKSVSNSVIDSLRGVQDPVITGVGDGIGASLSGLDVYDEQLGIY